MFWDYSDLTRSVWNRPLLLYQHRHVCISALDALSPFVLLVSRAVSWESFGIEVKQTGQTFLRRETSRSTNNDRASEAENGSPTRFTAGNRVRAASTAAILRSAYKHAVHQRDGHGDEENCENGRVDGERPEDPYCRADQPGHQVRRYRCSFILNSETTVALSRTNPEEICARTISGVRLRERRRLQQDPAKMDPGGQRYGGAALSKGPSTLCEEIVERTGPTGACRITDGIRYRSSSSSSDVAHADSPRRRGQEERYPEISAAFDYQKDRRRSTARFAARVRIHLEERCETSSGP